MANQVPIIVKHTALAIYKKGGIDGSTDKEKFRSAWNIARARLTEYGILIKGSEEGPGSRIRLTGKGRSLNALHARESDKAGKNIAFDKLYEDIQRDEQEGKIPPN